METDMTLSTHEIGKGHPVLIIHGWEMSGKVEEYDFEPIFTNTVVSYCRIYVDLPGMGKTPANNIKDLDDIYLRLVGFIDARLANSRFCLVGSSCGGYLAMALAARYVEQVDGLLLRVPLVEPEDSLRDLDPFQAVVRNDELMSRIPSEDKAQLGDILVQTPHYIQALKRKYEEVYLPAVEAADKKVLEPIRADPRRYHLSSLADSYMPGRPKLLAPTLIVCGRQDESVGFRDSLRLLERYPRSTYVVLDRGTHALPVDENGVFGVLVRDWLMRVDEWR